jgi:hypothetical protein
MKKEKVFGYSTIKAWLSLSVGAKPSSNKSNCGDLDGTLKLLRNASVLDVNE